MRACLPLRQTTHHPLSSPATRPTLNHDAAPPPPRPRSHEAMTNERTRTSPRSRHRARRPPIGESAIHRYSTREDALGALRRQCPKHWHIRRSRIATPRPCNTSTGTLARRRHDRPPSRCRSWSIPAGMSVRRRNAGACVRVGADRLSTRAQVLAHCADVASLDRSSTRHISGVGRGVRAAAKAWGAKGALPPRHASPQSASATSPSGASQAATCDAQETGN